MREFHILVLDDDVRVIQRLRDRISPQHMVLAKTWNVLIHGVHVDIVQNPDKPLFSDNTLKQIISACAQPPNLVLADFGYATQQQINQLNDGLLSPEQFMDSILTLPDLVPEVERFTEAQFQNDKQLAAQIRAGLRENSCKMYLYTYTSVELKNALPSVAARARRAQNIFRRTTIVPIDTLEEFYDNGKYAIKHDKDYYAYLMAGLLESLIRQELLIFALERETEALRYIRYYKSGAGVLFIVLLGGAIGAGAEWLGERVMGLILGGFWVPAMLIIALASLLFFILGLFVPILFERFMSNLLKKLRDEVKDLG